MIAAVNPGIGKSKSQFEYHSHSAVATTHVPNQISPQTSAMITDTTTRRLSGSGTSAMEAA